jgi:hypothetical protein
MNGLLGYLTEHCCAGAAGEGAETGASAACSPPSRLLQRH